MSKPPPYVYEVKLETLHPVYLAWVQLTLTELSGGYGEVPCPACGELLWFYTSHQRTHEDDNPCRLTSSTQLSTPDLQHHLLASVWTQPWLTEERLFERLITSVNPLELQLLGAMQEAYASSST